MCNVGPPACAANACSKCLQYIGRGHIPHICVVQCFQHSEQYCQFPSVKLLPEAWGWLKCCHYALTEPVGCPRSSQLTPILLCIIHTDSISLHSHFVSLSMLIAELTHLCNTPCCGWQVCHVYLSHAQDHPTHSVRACLGSHEPRQPLKNLWTGENARHHTGHSLSSVQQLLISRVSLTQVNPDKATDARPWQIREISLSAIIRLQQATWFK